MDAKELTSEDRERIFAMYLGCKYVKHYISITSGNERSLTNNLNVFNLYFDDDAIKSSETEAQLILKPLSEISDEDAIEVAKLCASQVTQYHKEDDISFHVLQKDTAYTRIEIKVRDTPYYMVSIKSHAAWLIPYDGRIYANGDKPMYNANQFQIADFLRSRGYALPYKGIDLFEAGIAITTNQPQ